jgi:hypothetical protein
MQWKKVCDNHRIHVLHTVLGDHRGIIKSERLKASAEIYRKRPLVECFAKWRLTTRASNQARAITIHKLIKHSQQQYLMQSWLRWKRHVETIRITSLRNVLFRNQNEMANARKALTEQRKQIDGEKLRQKLSWHLTRPLTIAFTKWREFKRTKKQQRQSRIGFVLKQLAQSLKHRGLIQWLKCVRYMQAFEENIKVKDMTKSLQEHSHHIRLISLQQRLHKYRVQPLISAFTRWREVKTSSKARKMHQVMAVLIRLTHFRLYSTFIQWSRHCGIVRSTELKQMVLYQQKQANMALSVLRNGD